MCSPGDKQCQEKDTKRGCLLKVFAKNFTTVIESIIIMLGEKLVDWGIDMLKTLLQPVGTHGNGGTPNVLGEWRPAPPSATTITTGILRFMRAKLIRVGPLLIWPNALRRLIDLERQQFLHLAEWMRLRSGNPRAGQLVAAAERIRPNGLLFWAPTVIGSVCSLTTRSRRCSNARKASTSTTPTAIVTSTLRAGRLR